MPPCRSSSPRRGLEERRFRKFEGPPTTRTTTGPALKDIKRLERFASLDALNRALVRECARSELFEGARVVCGCGPETARVMVVGEAPGRDETRLGEPFVGRAGRLLMELLRDGLGMEREEVYITNVVKVWPLVKTKRLRTRPPTRGEREFFLEYLIEELRLIAPAAVVAVGRTAFAALCQDACFEPGRWDEGPERVPVMPVYHPSYLLRRQKSLAENFRAASRTLAMVRDAI